MTKERERLLGIVALCVLILWAAWRGWYRDTPADSPAPRAFLRTAKATEAPASCASRYAKLYRGDALEMRVVFGYKDVRPSRFVGDRYEAAMVAAYLTAPCVPGWYACGFVRNSEDPELFEKRVFGPMGAPHHVRLRLVHSSAGPDDDENRRDPMQKWRTQHAKGVWLSGIETADVVFYNGHSRDGGGPDFAPPRLAGNGHVDYTWYVRNRPGFEDLLPRLERRGNRVALLGLFSCASTGHFLEELHEARRDMALITSPRLIYYTDALQNLLGALSSLLGQKCKADFANALRAKAEVGSSQLTGFFERN